MTRSAGRRFGLTVGGAFLAIAALTWWRGYSSAPVVFGALGATLGLAGLVIPSHLGPVERIWMAIAHAISRVTTPIVMGVMYLLVLTPAGALRRGFAGNPLVHAEQDHGYWRSRPAGRRRSADMRRQF
jgi:hypothetical protein